MIYFKCEVDHQQTFTPLFDCEKFLPSPLFVFIKKDLAISLQGLFNWLGFYE
jgi:hypothetical protein